MPALIKREYAILISWFVLFSIGKSSGVAFLWRVTYAHLSMRFAFFYLLTCGPGSSVGIATELRAGRSGIESQWGRDFPPVHTGPGAHPASCKMGTGSFPGVKSGRGVMLTPHPLLVPWSRKSRAIPLPPPYGPYGLYRASVPVQGCTLPYLFTLHFNHSNIWYAKYLEASKTLEDKAPQICK